MAKHSFKDYLIAVRSWSFPASAMPVLVGSCYALWTSPTFSWLNAVWALVAIIVFHAAGNAWSDYFDYKTGVDTPETHGSISITSGMFTSKEIIRLSIVLLCVASLLGIGLLWRCGMPLLWIGLGGLACALLYPFCKYRALGDTVIFIAYGLLPLLGTVYATTGVWNYNVLWLALPVGLITVAILHVNNLRDIRSDRDAHIWTVSMLFGERVSVWVYCLEVLAPFIAIVVFAVLGILPLWSLLCLLALPKALGNCKQAWPTLKGQREGLTRLDEGTAQLQAMTSVLLSCSLVVAHFV